MELPEPPEAACDPPQPQSPCLDFLSVPSPHRLQVKICRSKKSAKDGCKRKSTNAQTFSNIRAFPGYICCRSHLVTGIVKSNSMAVQDSSQWKCVITIGYMKFVQSVQ